MNIKPPQKNHEKALLFAGLEFLESVANESDDDVGEDSGVVSLLIFEGRRRRRLADFAGDSGGSEGVGVVNEEGSKRVKSSLVRRTRESRRGTAEVVTSAGVEVEGAMGPPVRPSSSSAVGASGVVGLSSSEVEGSRGTVPRTGTSTSKGTARVTTAPPPPVRTSSAVGTSRKIPSRTKPSTSKGTPRVTSIPPPPPLIRTSSIVEESRVKAPQTRPSSMEKSSLPPPPIRISPTAETSKSPNPRPTTPPLRTTITSPPPESSRFIFNPKKPLKRKRKSSTPLAPLSSSSKMLFNNLVFFFVPNDIKNPVRKAQMMKADEYGAFVSSVWDEGKITHIIVNKSYNHTDVLKILKIEKIPKNIILVNTEYTCDCLHFGRILDHTQDAYKIAGHEMVPAPPPPPPPLPAVISTGKLKSKTRNWKGIEETQNSSQEEESVDIVGFTRVVARKKDGPVEVYSTTTALTKRTSSAIKPAESSSDPSRVDKAIKDDLDEMIAEAKKMGYMPSLEDDDEEEKKTVAEDSDTSEEGEESHRKKHRVSSKNPGVRLASSKFQCMHKNDGTSTSSNPNKRTIQVLTELQTYYERISDHWRSLSYRKAIATLKHQNQKIIFASDAIELPNIESRIASKIEEIVQTDHLRRLDYARLDPIDEILKLFMGVYGAGLVQAQTWIAAGFKTLADLESKAKLTESQRIGVEHYHDFAERIPRAEVQLHGNIVAKIAHSIDPTLVCEIMGSFRRGSEDCGDIDIMLTKPSSTSQDLCPILSSLLSRLFSLNFLQCALASPRGRGDGSKWHGASRLTETHPWRRIDFLMVPWKERGAARIYFTGNDIFNRSMRLLASRMGYRLNQRGLWKDVMRGANRARITDGTCVEGESEERIFELLGVPYRPPEHRIC